MKNLSVVVVVVVVVVVIVKIAIFTNTLNHVFLFLPPLFLSHTPDSKTILTFKPKVWVNCNYNVTGVCTRITDGPHSSH